MRICQLLEQSQPYLQSQPSTWQQFVAAKHTVSTALKALDRGIQIYRGIKQDSPVRFKPQMPAGYRESANTDNYYTLVLDNDPAWENYPRRSASVIASTSQEYASSYGPVYLLLPEGTPQVGVCSAKDLWDSFTNLYYKTDREMFDLSDLNTAFADALRKLLHIANPRSMNYQELMLALQQAQDKFDTLKPAQVEHLDLFGSTHKLLELMPGEPFSRKLSDLLNPDANKFNLVSWNDLEPHTHYSREVWFSAPVWMLNTDGLPNNDLTSDVLMDYAEREASKE